MKLSLVPIIIGSVLNSIFDLSFNLYGVIFGLVGVLFTSYYSVLIGGIKRKLKINSQQLLLYQAPISSLFMTVMLLGMQENFSILQKFMSDDTDALVNPALLELESNFNLSQTTILLSSGFLAYGVNLTTYWIIGNTSILTYAIWGKVKFIVTIFLGLLFFNESINFLQFCSILCLLSGVVYYSFVKYLESIEILEPKPVSNLNKV